jgi:CubicO group peptidase (beta-lactamase class C family)
MNASEHLGMVQAQVESEVHGLCKEAFAPVRAAFAQNFYLGADVGASVAIFVDGEPVVDLWGGYFDTTYTRPFERDSIVQGFSSTKTITALCALILADRGEIDLDAPVAKYWPEFAAAGKGDVRVQQLLGHTSGVAGWTEPTTLLDIYDWEKSTAILTRQAPWWTPGRTSGYHGINQGHLVGEVVRRVTGKTLGTFLAEDVAGPLGVGTDYYIGTPAEADARVSLLIKGRPNDRPMMGTSIDRALWNPHPTLEDTWSLEWRRAEIGAVNGHGNARGIATLQSVLASGGANGVRLMSDAGRERVLEQQSDGLDLVLGIEARWGMGYSLEQTLAGAPASARVAHWAGNGGSLSFVDLDARMAIGYTPNRWLGGSYPLSMQRAINIVKAAYASVGGRL